MIVHEMHDSFSDNSILVQTILLRLWISFIFLPPPTRWWGKTQRKQINNGNIVMGSL